jgi:hypothetical protein
VPDAASLSSVVRGLTSQVGTTYTTDASDGWRRATAYLHEPGRLEGITQILTRVGNGRAALAEDFDEYGALWVVVSVKDGEVRTVHRRWVLNADPEDAADVARAVSAEAQDLRLDDVAGEEAAADAARLFGIDPEEMVEAERSSDSAYLKIGIVGGPFPWWNALSLPWPEPGAGQVVTGEETT